jgi:hypothetical protein
MRKLPDHPVTLLVLSPLFLVVCGGGAGGGTVHAPVPTASTVAVHAVAAGLEPANMTAGYRAGSAMLVVTSAQGSVASGQGLAIALMAGPGGNFFSGCENP